MARLMAVTLTVAVLIASAQAVSGVMYEPPSDVKITASVKSLLTIDDRLGSLAEVEVKTVERTVYLMGIARSAQEKNRAEELARFVAGVKNVVNDIELQP